MTPHEDKVWFDGRRKLDGICRDVSEAVTAGSNALILAHFQSTLDAVEASLRARRIEYKSYLPLDFSSLCAGRHSFTASNVWAGLASYFQARALSPSEKSHSSLSILLAEHHPLASRDRAVMDAAGSVPCSAQVIFHSSLRDPILEHFGGDRLRSLMKQLGMDEHECISSPVISTAIRNAQEKIESKLEREMRTDSPEDWLKYNLRRFQP